MLTTHQRIGYTLLANAIFAIHLIIVLIVSLGWLVPGMFYVFLGAFTATLFSELFLTYCPLTRLEFGVRAQLNPSKVYDSSCMVHYGRALCGKGPRVQDTHIQTKPPTFFKKHSFLLILGGLFGASVVMEFLVRS